MAAVPLVGESLRQQTPSECEIRTNVWPGLGNHIAQAGESPKMSGRASGLKVALGGDWGKTPEQPIPLYLRWLGTQA